MAAGFLWSVIIGGTEGQFQDVEIDDENAPIEASSRLFRSGAVNTGFTSREADLATLMVNINSLMFPAGAVYSLIKGANVVTWSIKYASITLYSGTRLYVQRYSFSGRVPGNAVVRLTFFADEAYTTVAPV